MCLCEISFFFLWCSSTFNPPGCPAPDSVVVLEEGSGLSAARPTAAWVDSDEFGPVSSNAIYMSSDKSTKTPPSGTLSRVGTLQRLSNTHTDREIRCRHRSLLPVIVLLLLSSNLLNTSGIIPDGVSSNRH